MSDTPLDAALVVLRDRDDPMVGHEVACFTHGTGLSLEILFAIDGQLGARDLERDLLLFGGSGAYSVLDPIDWVKRGLDFLAEVAHAGVPTWASCFGFQGLALAMGGRVERDDSRQRLGAYSVRLTEAGQHDPLLESLPSRFRAQFGHHDHVVEVPSGVAVLAVTDGPGEACEAFRVEGTRCWGGQFHPELNKQGTWERWLRYRDLYAVGMAEQIEAHLQRESDTPEPMEILPRLVQIARERRGE
ncbi:MAG: type 1 glutamine amidotransferase [Myxococcota bacterium]|nr:type 1 glutamine amidotransferase [Myxococcota bacterium]